MARDDETDDPTKQLKQGLGLLFKAARGLAKEARKELETTDFGKALDDAGRELVRATSSVVNRIAEEVNAAAKPRSGGSAPPPAPHDEHADAAPPADEEDEFDGVRPKARASTDTTDPGPRIVVDDEPKKPS